jgi:hypothetical protein
MGKSLPVPGVQEVHRGGSNVWPDNVQEEVKRWLCLQDASFYLRGYDPLIYRYDNCLNRYGSFVKK